MDPEKISLHVSAWMPTAYHKEANPVMAGIGQILSTKDGRERLMGMLEDCSSLPGMLVFKEIITRVIPAYLPKSGKGKGGKS